MLILLDLPQNCLSYFIFDPKEAAQELKQFKKDLRTSNEIKAVLKKTK